MKKLILAFIVLPILGFTQSVSGTFSPSEDFTYAFLYKATPEGADYVDRGKLDSLGYFNIPLDESVTPGIYKIVYAVPPEENNFDFIYDGNESIDFNFSYDNGVEFNTSEENKLWKSYLKSMDMVNITISNYFSQDVKDEDGFKAIFKTLNDTQKGYEELASGKLVASFIIANRPYIPQEYEDLSTYSKNLKRYYLNQVDFDNFLLQSSSFLVDRITSYVFNMVQNPSNDTFKIHVDDVYKAISDSSINIKTTLLEVLWQRFVSLENHELANYIADTYLLSLANINGKKVLAETITSYKNTSVGTKAPNFEIKSNDKTTDLHSLDGSEYYLLVFWSSGCGHCLNELPKVKELAANKTNIKVVAFGLENDSSDWTKEIKKYPDFTHTIGLGKWENPVVKTYGIAATPSYFLLDKNKLIIAKPYTFEDIETTIKNL